MTNQINGANNAKQTINGGLNNTSNSFFIISFIEDIILKITGNISLTVFISLIIIILSKVYYAAKDRLEEMNLFNVDAMNEEEKKLFYYTRRLTFINEKNQGKSAHTLANKGKYFNFICIIIF